MKMQPVSFEDLKKLKADTLAAKNGFNLYTIVTSKGRVAYYPHSKKFVWTGEKFDHHEKGAYKMYRWLKQQGEVYTGLDKVEF